MVLITIIGLIVNYITHYLRLQFLLQPSGIMIIWIRNTTNYLNWRLLEVYRLDNLKNILSTIIESIKKEILNWPNVTAEPHRFGGLEFRLNKREMGHMHGDKLGSAISDRYKK
jgi:hypothetical protein